MASKKRSVPTVPLLGQRCQFASAHAFLFVDQLQHLLEHVEERASLRARIFCMPQIGETLFRHVQRIDHVRVR